MPVYGTNEPAAFGITPRMARALADPWKIRILTELSVRTLSPSQFVSEFGGDLNEIARCFRQLADLGYIELIEERPGRQHVVAIEHVYRGVNRAHFDMAAWESVPASERSGVSCSVLDSYFARISEAIEMGTFDEEVDRHLSWDGVVLDRTAWSHLGECLDNVLDRVTALGERSSEARSLLHCEWIPTIVGLLSFRSPQSPYVMLKAPRRQEAIGTPEDPSSPVAIPLLMAKALSNRWRCRILMELTARPMSPSEFVERVGGKLSNIARCFRELANWKFIEVIEERRGGRHGGGVERIYRNTKRAYFDTDSWVALPRLIRNEVSWSCVDSLVDRVIEAVEANTFDAEPDRHLSWTPVIVDRQGWQEIGTALDEILYWLPQLEAESLNRVGEAPDQLIPTIVGLSSFRSPEFQ